MINQQEQDQKQRLLHDLRMQESYLRKNAEAVEEIYGTNKLAQNLAEGSTQTKFWIKQIEQEINP